MITAIKEIPFRPSLFSSLFPAQLRLKTQWQNRLTEAFQSAKVIEIDDASRICFFGDCHRGDKSQNDLFASNDELHYQTLSKYLEDGFIYIETGDGDDLWSFQHFDDIREAYNRTFDLFHHLNARNRIQFIIGNHDIGNGKTGARFKDGIQAHEAIILQHEKSKKEIYVVHGHQADFWSDRMLLFSRFFIRHIWWRLARLRIHHLINRTAIVKTSTDIIGRMTQWANLNKKTIICGHIHEVIFPQNGSDHYFTTGSCTHPGYITGIEIRDGKIMPVMWRSVTNGKDKRTELKRTLLAKPRSLWSLMG